jgi:hypothetical protein
MVVRMIYSRTGAKELSRTTNKSGEALSTDLPRAAQPQITSLNAMLENIGLEEDKPSSSPTDQTRE